MLSVRKIKETNSCHLAKITSATGEWKNQSNDTQLAVELHIFLFFHLKDSFFLRIWVKLLLHFVSHFRTLSLSLSSFTFPYSGKCSLSFSLSFVSDALSGLKFASCFLCIKKIPVNRMVIQPAVDKGLTLFHESITRILTFHLCKQDSSSSPQFVLLPVHESLSFSLSLASLLCRKLILWSAWPWQIQLLSFCSYTQLDTSCFLSFAAFLFRFFTLSLSLSLSLSRVLKSRFDADASAFILFLFFSLSKCVHRVHEWTRELQQLFNTQTTVTRLLQLVSSFPFQLLHYIWEERGPHSRHGTHLTPERERERVIQVKPLGEFVHTDEEEKKSDVSE